MTQKIQVTPGALSVLQAKFGIAVAIAFLVFGLAFGGVIASETPSSESGMAVLMGLFMLIWVAVCVGMIVTFARVVRSGGAPADRSLVELQIDAPAAPSSGAAAPSDFDARLRKLEGLRKDGLISEAEYKQKREEILRDAW